MRAAVALPAILGFFGADGLLFSVADQGQLIIRNSHGNQELLYVVCSAIAQGQVVFLGAALVGVTFDEQLLAGIVGENFTNHVHVVFQSDARVGANSALIEVEERVFKPRQAGVQSSALSRRGSGTVVVAPGPLVR